MKTFIFILFGICIIAAIGNATPAPIAPKVLSVQADTSKIAQVTSGKLKTANASWWGFNKEDSTEVLQNAINSGVPKLIVDNTGSDWVINKPLNLVSNQEIVFADGVVIQAKKDYFHGVGDSLFLAKNLTNVILRGEGIAVLRMRKTDYQDATRYTPAEWRSGISLYDCSNVTLRNLTIAQTGGDGLYLGSSIKDGYNKNIVVEKVVFDGNHRQGISIISVDGFIARNCKFINTSGTPPQAGIDFEPNNAGQRLTNCLVEDSVFLNNAGDGIDIYTPTLNGSSHPLSITFNRCKVSGSAQWGLASIATNSSDNSVKGVVSFNKCTFDGDAIFLGNAVLNSVHYSFNDCVQNFDASKKEAAYNSAPIVLGVDPNIANPVIGNIDFGNMTVTSKKKNVPIKTDFWRDVKISDQVTGTIKVKQGNNSSTAVLPDYMREHQKEIAISPEIKDRQFREKLLKSDARYLDPNPEQTKKRIQELELSGALKSNLVTNGTFSMSLNKSDWSAWQASSSSGTLEWDGAINHGVEAGGAAVLTNVFQGSIGQNIDVISGGTYVVRGWMRRSGMGTGNLGVGWKDAGKKWLYQSLGPRFYAEDDKENTWILLEGIVTAPQDAHVMYISCGARYQRFSKDKIWFDDIAVYRIDNE